MKGLQVPYPLYMPNIELMLALNVLEDLMIRVKNEFNSNEVVTLVF